MPTLEDIRKPIEGYIARYEDFVNSLLGSDSDYVNAICSYVLSKRGKQMRPMLVLLAAALHGNVTEDSYMGAALIEMVHSASLMHDDVIDSSDMRRGAPSVNAIWGTQVAVLAGDYVLGRTFHTCLQHGNMTIINEVTGALAKVTEGELIQTEQTETLAMTEDIYYDIIAKKTAALIAASGAVGAVSAGAAPEQVGKMRDFGKYLGIAFQIKDDILDFSPADIIGKPTCGDIRERKITLPLLHVLDNATETEREKMMSKLKTAGEVADNTRYLYDAVMNGGGLEYAAAQMKKHEEKALACLNGYPESAARNSMAAFADFVLERDK